MGKGERPSVYYVTFSRWTGEPVVLSWEDYWLLTSLLVYVLLFIDVVALLADASFIGIIVLTHLIALVVAYYDHGRGREEAQLYLSKKKTIN